MFHLRVPKKRRSSATLTRSTCMCVFRVRMICRDIYICIQGNDLAANVLRFHRRKSAFVANDALCRRDQCLSWLSSSFHVKLMLNISLKMHK